MPISKSSRHPYIVGKFGEYVICNWLSRSGFEVTIVDHTGMDMVAYNPKTKQRLGITVKSRTRNVGSETTSVTVFRYSKQHNDRVKLMEGCESFACEPWIAVYVETENFADIFLTSLVNFDNKYRIKMPITQDTWKMSSKHLDNYRNDPSIKHIRINFDKNKWSW